jgi:hypothetical protein
MDAFAVICLIKQKAALALTLTIIKGNKDGNYSSRYRKNR